MIWRWCGEILENNGKISHDFVINLCMYRWGIVKMTKFKMRVKRESEQNRCSISTYDCLVSRNAEGWLVRSRLRDGENLANFTTDQSKVLEQLKTTKVFSIDLLFFCLKTKTIKYMLENKKIESDNKKCCNRNCFYVTCRWFVSDLWWLKSFNDLMCFLDFIPTYLCNHLNEE